MPPPPQPGGAGAAPGQPGWGRRHPILTGCLGIIALFVILGIIGAAIGGGGDETAGGGGGGGKPAKNDNPPAEEAKKNEPNQANKPEKIEEKPQAEKKPPPTPTYRVGQTARVGHVEWTVKDAYLTNQLRSSFGTQKSGRFVVVDFIFVNHRDEEVTLDPDLHMTLKDSRGREFGTDPDAYEFMPSSLDIFLEPVNPGVSKAGRAIYQVSPDATGFRLTVDDVEFMEDKSAVFDLSNIRPQTYSTASASSTATATAGP